MKKYEMDRFYSSIKNKYDALEMHEAGYIKESCDWLENIDLSIDQLTLPEYSKSTKNIVLLSTGSFAPIHEGHIEMMEQAKKRLEEEGYNVIHGYLSTSHDQYVLNKIHPYNLEAKERIKLIDKAIENTEWLTSLNWEALGVDEAINFTTVMLYLENRLKEINCEDVKVAFVFGSDNYAFSRAFEEQGIAVCVDRGCERTLRKVNKNTFYQSTNKHKSVSSTAKRCQNIYLIRDDFFRSTKGFTQSEHNIFIPRLQSLIQEQNSLTKNVSVFTEDHENISIENLHLDNYVSLDVYHGNHKVRCSRLFEIETDQIAPKDVIFKNEKDLAFDNLFDDDSISGNTIRMLEEKKGERFSTKSFLINLVRDRFFKGKKIIDVVDARDFVLGAKEGGLYVETKNGKRFKVPYIYPFVNLTTRANIPDEKQINFTIDILKLNRAIYTSNNKSISEISEDLVKLAEYLNIEKNISILQMIDLLLTKTVSLTKNKIIEVGHMYLDELFGAKERAAAKIYKENFNDSPAIFMVDDLNISEEITSIHRVITEFEDLDITFEKVGKESEMVKLSKFIQDDLSYAITKEKFRKEDKFVYFINFGSKKIAIKTVDRRGNPKYHCSMLSLTWALLKLGHFGRYINNYDKYITLLSEEFMGLEEDTISTLENFYPQYRGKITNIYY